MTGSDEIKVKRGVEGKQEHGLLPSLLLFEKCVIAKDLNAR